MSARRGRLKTFRRGGSGSHAPRATLMRIKGMQLGTCLSIDLTIAHMCKVTLIKIATRTTIVVPTNSFPLLGRISK